MSEEEKESNEEEELQDDIHQALITNDDQGLSKLFTENSAVTLADALAKLDNDEVVLFFSSIHQDYDKLGEIFSYLYIEERKAVVSNLNKRSLGPILANVSNDDLEDFLEDIPKKLRLKVLSYLPGKRRAVLEKLAKYSDDTIGSIMTTEYLAIPSGSSVSDVLLRIKQIGNKLETVRTIFIVDSLNKLLGTIRLESMMFDDPKSKVNDVMKTDFAYISPIADKEQAVPICQEYDIPVLPVVSKDGEMLGIVTFDDVMDVLEEENTEDVYKQAAVTPTEKPYLETKVFQAARSYLIWLIILLMINTFTGIIISRFELALLALPILLSFIPALNDTCGNSGSQTSSMVVRALTMENLTKKDYPKIIGKEALTGLLTGAVVSLFNFGWIMLELNTPLLNVTESMQKTLTGELGLPLEVGYLVISGIASIALFFCVFFSKLFASILPLIAKALHLDPAVMSGPLVTALMDIFTLLLYFTIAVAVLHSLNPELPL